MNLLPADEKTILFAASLLICTASVLITSLPSAITIFEHETVLAFIYEDDPDEGGQIERSDA